MKISGNQVRQSFIDFFVKKGHTFVPSSSLVPGGDQTLLFTNAGMVQFKDVFLGTDQRPYTRAVNSQKCMRVAGKHNDLDDVGRDDTHHTFFEMLGNWSFGDYYKNEAIAWAWELLTEVWGLQKERLWATCFKDDKGNIPSDDEAANIWRSQPGFFPDHVLFFGRKDNFWEMADTGPCGPCSEIHYDRGVDYCDKGNVPGHQCKVNGDCKRFLELWNLVFIQYNRLSPIELEPLPARHVDTGMGFERIVSVLQNVNSNYRTDLLFPAIEKVRELTKHTEFERDSNFTPYRVIADHARAATFLISDGVVPGNTGRNYVCRMIIRRAVRFGTKLGLNEPFLAKISQAIISNYGGFYQDLEKNQSMILAAITREEERFQKTLESGIGELQNLVDELNANSTLVLSGKKAFDLYATHGLPLELTRDILRELNMDVDVAGFQQAMEEHRAASGAGKAFGPLGGEDVNIYRDVFEELKGKTELDSDGVEYDPYSATQAKGKLLAIIRTGEVIRQAQPGDEIEVILPKSCFYLESGGQVSDTGVIQPLEGEDWLIQVTGTRKPAAGIITLIGRVEKGSPRVGEMVIAKVDLPRRIAIMRNHTATHLLQAELRKVLGEHVRQAGSLVAPDYLRFDFIHNQSVTPDQIDQIEDGINSAILNNLVVIKEEKSLSEAVSEGATALFGEKYGETVKTVRVEGDEFFSYELCGGTHVDQTSQIGLFVITSEGSAAAGIRRIIALTGNEAYKFLQNRVRTVKRVAGLCETDIDELYEKVQSILHEISCQRKEIIGLRQKLATIEFEKSLSSTPRINDVPLLVRILDNADIDTLRSMTDLFRARYKTGVVVLGSVYAEKPIIIASVTDDLVKRGISAGEIVRQGAQVVGGGGGGRPTLAQAGGKDPHRLPEALAHVEQLVKAQLEK